jgi:RAMP superfamily
MPNRFHNPYHFVPTPSQNGPGLVPRDATQWPAHLRHDRFVLQTKVDGITEAVFSGRLVCRAIVQELLAVGAKQSEGQKPSRRGANDAAPREVQLFRLGDKFALPGSSLRGMLAALAEAGSNSTLRILTDHELSLKPNGGAPTTPRGTVHDFFRKRNTNLVPLTSGDGRTHLTVAEQLFGCVEQMGHDAAKGQTPALALASRLRVSHALAHGTTPTRASKEITKILGSPKFRYPSFHFNATEDGEFLSRDNNALDLTQGHFPKGRKFYLHRDQIPKVHRAGRPSEWVSASPNDQKTLNQKALVAPLESGEFWFHLDFDNLAQLELELLCYAISPSDSFFHKLGLGKPLGLGKLKLETMGLFLIDRTARYKADLNTPRYSTVWKTSGTSQWPESYETEVNASVTKDAKSPIELRRDYCNRIATSHPHMGPVLRAIELLGDPATIKLPVHYPQIPLEDLESELFLWFQRNEDRQGQFLRSLTNANTCGFTELPSLERAPSASPPDPSCWPNGVPPAPQAAAVPGRAISTPVSVPQQPKGPAIPAGIHWQGPVPCQFLGKSKSQKWKFQIGSGTAQQTGVLWEEFDLAKLPADLKEGGPYDMEYLPIGNANYRFRFV